MSVIDYIHEFHPYDWLFVVPVAVSALMFWRHRGSRFSFLETVFGSAVASAFVTVMIMALRFGVWSLIGITAGFIVLIYLPICAVVGILTSRVVERA